MEKSLQRFHSGLKIPMYVTLASVESRVRGASGWQEVLTVAGFRFHPPLGNTLKSTNDAGSSDATRSNETALRSVIFLPSADPVGRLAQCSATLQALLGLFDFIVLSYLFISCLIRANEMHRVLIRPESNI